MTTLRQIKLSCPIGSAALISPAKRFNPGSGVGREERALLAHQTSAHRVTRTRPAENHFYSRCA